MDPDGSGAQERTVAAGDLTGDTGSQGGAGVLVVAYDAGRLGDVAAWAYPLTLRLQALDAGGETLWETAFDGTHAAVNFVGQAGARVPFFAGSSRRRRQR